jgi:CRISPR-associated protein (TIGR03986 family)
MIGEDRIRVRLKDGKKSTYGKVKFQLGTDLQVFDAGNGCEFVICATSQERIERVRSALGAAGLEEIPGSTEVRAPTPVQNSRGPRTERGRTPTAQPARSTNTSSSRQPQDLPKKPYAFVPLPDEFSTAEPVWHDGTSSADRISGEIRFEMENLTPLLVGWERRTITDQDDSNPWPTPVTAVESAEEVDVNIPGAGRTIRSKSVLYPLRAPWADRPVIITGDSLKGLLRHELGALLGAPMERVAERSYSYRPNSLYPNQSNPRLLPRLARVPKDGLVMREVEEVKVRVPTTLELLPADLKYDKQQKRGPSRYRFDPAGGGGLPYRGGLGVGQKLNSKSKLHARLEAEYETPEETVAVPQEVQEAYLNTLRHLADLKHGHFSERHPDVPGAVTADDARRRILQAAENVVFSPGDLIWVEWDTQRKQIVSFGWHYYYRWAYQDTVRLKGWTAEREGLYPLPDEKDEKGDGPARLSPVRRLFGYTGDNKGSAGIGKGDYSQLMGRISINAALEIVPGNSKEDDRFLAPTFLKELGMPRPSAVEFYLQQPYYPETRPSDRARLVTYGDAVGHDEPGRLSGRKFYLDRCDAYTYTGKPPWEDDSESNRLNDRSTLALEASRPGSRFRFTLRFRDLDPPELADVLLGFCPHQFREAVGGKHSDGYCSKLGYARPLGWGTIRIEAKELYLLKNGSDRLMLEKQPDLGVWFQQNFHNPPLLKQWLDVHRCKHPDAKDYPRSPEDGQIYTFHTNLRAEHTRLRRYDGGKSS